MYILANTKISDETQEPARFCFILSAITIFALFLLRDNDNNHVVPQVIEQHTPTNETLQLFN